MKINNSRRPTIALTGATGFLGTHIALQLLQRGMNIHACVRGGESSPKLEFLKQYYYNEYQKQQEKHQGSPQYPNQHFGFTLPPPATIKFFDTDLVQPDASEQLQRAFEGCDHVIHTAAVALAHARVDDPRKEIIEPCVRGMENVLDAFTKTSPLSSSPMSLPNNHKNRRLVFTSSQVALWDVTKHPDFDERTQRPLTYTESDFNTFVTSRGESCGGDYYGYAKTVSEKLALDRDRENGGDLDVVSLLPTAILGKCLTKSHSKASPVWIRNILQCNKQLDFRCGWVDVEDCAFAHIQACLFDKDEARKKAAGKQKFIETRGNGTRDGAKMNRFILSAQDSSLSELSPIIQRFFPRYKADFHNPEKKVLEQLEAESEHFRLHSKQKRFVHDNTLSQEVLDVKYPPIEETLRKTVKSLVDGGYCKPVTR